MKFPKGLFNVFHFPGESYEVSRLMNLPFSLSSGNRNVEDVFEDKSSRWGARVPKSSTGNILGSRKVVILGR